MSDMTPPPPPPPPGMPPQGPPPGYSAYGGPGMGPVESSKKALWAMICGIFGILCCGPVAIVAIVLGKQAQAEIDNSGGRITGRGQATAGFICGIVGVVLWALLTIVRVSNT